MSFLESSSNAVFKYMAVVGIGNDGLAVECEVVFVLVG